MAVSGITASPQPQQAAQSSAHHQRRSGGQMPSLSDVDAQSSSAASNRPTGRAGGRVDISA
jgi:hypothetical protein